MNSLEQQLKRKNIEIADLKLKLLESCRKRLAR